MAKAQTPPASPKKPDVSAFTDGVDDEAEDATIKIDMSQLEADEPSLPGFSASDEPLPPPRPSSPAARAPDSNDSAGVEASLSTHTASPLAPETPIGAEQPSYIDTINSLAARNKAQNSSGRPPTVNPGIEGEIFAPSRPSGPVKYESRIRILDAWQYTGQVADAPDYVDRNWIGWADRDDVRRLDAGPCLRVPMDDAPNSPVTICRPGDYVVRQSTTFDDGNTEVEQVEVWEREQFQRLFLAVQNPPRSTPATLKSSQRRSPQTLDA